MLMPCEGGVSGSWGEISRGRELQEVAKRRCGGRGGGGRRRQRARRETVRLRLLWYTFSVLFFLWVG
jgi:hypothetical protein